jgi:transposase
MIPIMETAPPNEISALRSALAAALLRAEELAAENAQAEAERSRSAAVIAALQLEIARLRRELYGQRSERKARLLGQLELELEELSARASEDELAADQAAAETTPVKAFTRKKPARKPFPAHLPRERVVNEAPKACPCCGSEKLCKLGEDVTETLEVIPRQWKVIQTVREKFSCRQCEKITQAPAPFHVTPRGWAGPSLLAMILFEKYGQHQPLNRQSERYAREGVDLSLSTLADQVGACAFVLRPLHDLIAAQVLAAERLHGDDTTVPVLAKGKTRTGRVWTYVRDDKPFGGSGAPAALFYYSRDRSGEHPEKHLTGYGGILQADAYAGYNRLYDAERSPGPLLGALCWSHGRRKFFVLADLRAAAQKRAQAKTGGKESKQTALISPLALEAVERIDALFDIEREINGLSAKDRLAARAERSAKHPGDV